MSKSEIDKIFSSTAFSEFANINVMPLIYNEQKKQCNIMIFDHQKAIEQTIRIKYIGEGESFKKSQGRRRRWEGLRLSSLPARRHIP